MDRQSLRRHLIARRLALSAEAHAALSARLCGHLSQAFPQLAALRLAFCWPIYNEPDIRPLIASWYAAGAAGFCPLLPVVLAQDQPLAFRAWSPHAELVKDRYGIPTPTQGPLLQPDALLLPVNAFDAAAYRLGYGGGYFDRSLAVWHRQGIRPLTIGLGFELARVDSIKPEAHDWPLDAVVTEAGVFLRA